jgi:precorrin-4/cobalt-precorrin-4 C11-methyltransferase
MVVVGPAARKAGYERSYLYGDWANGGDADDSDGSTAENATELEAND